MVVRVTCTERSANKRVAKLYLREGSKDLAVLDVLGDEAAGLQGIILAEGIEGLHHLQFTRPIKKAAYQEGGTASPFARIDPREFEVTWITRGETITDLDRIESRLWFTINRHVNTVLRLYPRPGATNNWRELTFTMLGTPTDQTKRLNNAGEKAHAHKTKCVALEPYWHSELVEFTLKRTDMTQQPDGSWLGYIPVLNPADNDCYPQWGNGQMDAPEQWTLPDSDAVYDQFNAPTPAQIGKPIMHTLPLIQPGREFLISTYPTTPTLQTVPPPGQLYGGSGDWARMASENFEYPLKRSTPRLRRVPVRLVGGSVNSQISVFLDHRWDRPVGGEVIDE